MAAISNNTNLKLKAAAESLKSGNLVAFPTETVYGLGADASNERAVSRVYEVKGRPANHPLIVHISSLSLLSKWTRDIPNYAMELVKNFWPGPMTLILPKTNLAKSYITGGQDSVGVRVPNHYLALQLLKQFEDLGGLGIAAPSANRFGAVSPTTAAAVRKELGPYLSFKDLIIDGGKANIGLESTIISCLQASPIILRPGAVTSEMIKQVLGIDLEYDLHLIKNYKVRTSGLLESHYAPLAKVFLSGSPSTGDGFIALKSIVTPKGAVRLASPNTVEEYAYVIFEALRLADSKRLSRVYVIPPTGGGISVAINDRLIKAANKV
jgi:L-threonylcarbamoyladenylate synthase